MDENISERQKAQILHVNMMIDFLATQRRALLMQVRACENMAGQLRELLPPEAQPKPGQDVVIYRSKE